MKPRLLNDGAGQSADVEAASKRVILSMGGKGGVGKTSVIAGLTGWFDANDIPVKLLDLDTENKARGSLAHFFGERAPKVNIYTPRAWTRSSIILRMMSRSSSPTWAPGRDGLPTTGSTLCIRMWRRQA